MDILRKTFGINRTVVHHGKTAAGNDVKSLSSTLSDDGTAIRINREGDSNGYVAWKDELEIFSKNLLVGLGYTVTPPAA
jgi:hypothetical protein